MRLYRNLCEAVVNALEQIFTHNKYADKVIEKILKDNPKWGARDRKFIAETIYDIVRWHRLFMVVSNSKENDFWKLLGVWCVWNEITLPPWIEFKGIDDRTINTLYQEIKEDRKIRESIPDWLDELGQKELGEKWEGEIHALNEEARVV